MDFLGIRFLNMKKSGIGETQLKWRKNYLSVMATNDATKLIRNNSTLLISFNFPFTFDIRYLYYFSAIFISNDFLLLYLLCHNLSNEAGSWNKKKYFILRYYLVISTLSISSNFPFIFYIRCYRFSNISP